MVTQTISAPAAASWNADVLLNPSPLYFGKVISKAGATYGTNTIFNTQLGVANPSEFGATARTWNSTALATWTNAVTKYRLCYASVTATLTASATTNEGSVTSAQYPYSFREVSAPGQFDLTGNPILIYMNAKSRIVPANLRSPQTLQGMVGSTTWEAREGAYCILRLSEEALRWNSNDDIIGPQAITGTQVTASGQVPSTAILDFSTAAVASSTDTMFGPQGVWGHYVGTGTGATGVVGQTGDVLPRPCQDFMGHVSFNGLDAAASLVLTYRVGFEAVVPPESLYAGQVTPALQPDGTALDSYFAYARYLQSAYPASYNIFGMLAGLASAALPIIKDVGAKLLPSVMDAGKQMISSFVSPTTPSGAHTTSQSLKPPAPIASAVQYVQERVKQAVSKKSKSVKKKGKR